MDLARHRLETIIIMTRKDDKGDEPSGGETTWTNTGATRYGRGQHKTGSFGDDMLRPSPNHGTQRLPNDDDDEGTISFLKAKMYAISSDTHKLQFLKLHHFKLEII